MPDAARVGVKATASRAGLEKGAEGGAGPPRVPRERVKVRESVKVRECKGESERTGERVCKGELALRLWDLLDPSWTPSRDGTSSGAEKKERTAALPRREKGEESSSLVPIEMKESGSLVPREGRGERGSTQAALSGVAQEALWNKAGATLYDAAR